MSANHDPTDVRSARLCLALTVLVLIAGVVPCPYGWAMARSVLDSARSTELNRTDREAGAGGYYEGLIGGDGGEGSRSELAMRLLGKPSDWVRFDAANVSRHLDGDPLLYELKPNLHRTMFGHPFTTNSHGMRDREYPVTKPAGVFRIAVLGSSIDMGWGVGTESMYVNRLEDWLNAHAARRGSTRRFEVINFAVAAYSPLQRLEVFRRKALAFDPDLVLFSSTLLDIRLTEIYLCDLLQSRVALRPDFLRGAVVDAGIDPAHLRRDPAGKLADKGAIKAKLGPHYWPIYDATLGLLADDCRAREIALACMIIPRVGKADAPGLRDEPVSRLRGIAAHHAIPLLDLTGTFDGLDPSRLEIAAWDDHPNIHGHERLFLALARGLVHDKSLYETLYSPGPIGRAPEPRRPDPH
jgi:hypothetical protein